MRAMRTGPGRFRAEPQARYPLLEVVDPRLNFFVGLHAGRLCCCLALAAFRRRLDVAVNQASQRPAGELGYNVQDDAGEVDKVDDGACDGDCGVEGTARD